MKSAKILIIVLGTLSVVVSAQDIQQVAGDDFADHQDHSSPYQAIFQKDDNDHIEQDADIQVNDADVDDYPEVQFANLKTFAQTSDFDADSRTPDDDDDDDNEHAVFQDLQTKNVSSESASGSTCCPNNWLGYSNRCYRLYSALASWSSALSFCREFPGGSLARADSFELNRFIARSVAQGTENVWIGLHDRHSEGQFHWVDNNDHLHGFQHWARREPNDYRRTEDCVETNRDSLNGYWNDADCIGLRSFVCQRDEVDCCTEDR